MAHPTFDIDWPFEWSEADLDRLPEDGHRYEAIDGGLYMMPPPRLVHQHRVFVLQSILSASVEAGWTVESGLGVRVPHGNLVPDIVVLSPDADRDAVWHDARTVAMVMEVASPSTDAYDRMLKALKYAEAGIESYWRITLLGELVIHRAPSSTGYADVRTFPAGETVVLEQPFPVRVDLGGLDA